MSLSILLQLKDLRKIAKDFGEDIPDEDLSAMIDECKQSFLPQNLNKHSLSDVDNCSWTLGTLVQLPCLKNQVNWDDA
jgi:hypothetical protein